MAIGVFNLVFEQEYEISEGVLHLRFRKEEVSDFDFEPGQFITLLFGEGKELKRRSYSVASIPNSSDALAKVKIIEIAVSYIPNGFASEILFHLKPGQVLKAMGPVGRLTLKAEEQHKPLRLILVGTGTGIAPYRSMLPSLLERLNISDDSCSVEIILGVRTQAEALFKSDFEYFSAKHPRLKFHVCYSREKAEHLKKNESLGYVQDYFSSLNLNPERDIVYLCGNPHMIDESFELLKNVGFQIGNIRREKYISS